MRARPAPCPHSFRSPLPKSSASRPVSCSELAEELRAQPPRLLSLGRSLAVCLALKSPGNFLFLGFSTWTKPSTPYFLFHLLQGFRAHTQLRLTGEGAEEGHR